MDVDTIQTRVTDALTAVAQQASANSWPGPWDRTRGRPMWTEGVGDALRTVAQEAHLLPERGWLYDFTASEMTSGHRGLLVRLAFVAEYEWCLDPDVDPDFMKLIQARAGLRIFIFWAESADAVAATVARYKSQVSTFIESKPGDRYLFAGLERPSRSFRFEAYRHGS